MGAPSLGGRVCGLFLRFRRLSRRRPVRLGRSESSGNPDADGVAESVAAVGVGSCVAVGWKAPRSLTRELTHQNSRPKARQGTSPIPANLMDFNLLPSSIPYSMVTTFVNGEQPALLHALTFQLVRSYPPKNLLGATSNDWASSGAFTCKSSSNGRSGSEPFHSS